MLEGHRTHAHGELTARPKASSNHPTATEPNVADYLDIIRLGRVSKRLEAVRLRCPVAASVLEEYYSPGGGTLGVLWIFTHAGRAMLADNPLGLPPEALFANMREGQRRTPTPERRALFDQADESAERLLAMASAFWNLADGPLPAPRPVAPKPVRPAA